MVKKGLGRGLGALIPTAPAAGAAVLEENTPSAVAESGKVIEIETTKICPNKYQPRKAFNEEGLAELAQSITEHGIVQPIVVRKLEADQYQIVAGERRWRAGKIAGLATIPAIVKEYSEQETTAIALIENIQREDLNPLEEASAYQMLSEEFGLTQEELAKKVGKSRPYIANILRLLNLAEKVKEMLAAGIITTGHARALLPLPEAGQCKLAEKIQLEGLTVRETENLVKGISIIKNEQHQAQTKKDKPQQVIIPELIDLEERLQHFLGTRVRIIHNNNKGKIEIEYYSTEDLNRIVELLPTV